MKQMTPEKILIPVNGNGCDEDALRLAGEIARGHNKAKIYAVYVIQVRRDLPLDAEIAQETNRAEKVLHSLENLGRELKFPG